MAKKSKPVEVIDLDNLPKSGYSVPKLTDFSAASLDAAVDKLHSALDQELKTVASENDWKAFRDRWIARKNGILTQINDLWLKAAPGPNKPDVGQRVNKLRKTVEGMVEVAKNRLLFNKAIATEVVHPGIEVPAAELEAYALRVRLAAERVDVTLPGIRRPLGAEHPVIKTMNEMVGVFRNLGYSVEEGPEIETDYYNFEALNFPPNHPARDTQDTLFIAGQESKPQRVRAKYIATTRPTPRTRPSFIRSRASRSIPTLRFAISRARWIMQ